MAAETQIFMAGKDYSGLDGRELHRLITARYRAKLRFSCPGHDAFVLAFGRCTLCRE